MVYPNRKDVEWEEGCEEKVARYQFWDGAVKEHLFCPKCGTSLMIDFHDFHKDKFVGEGKGKGIAGIGEAWEVLGVSVRSFKGIDLKKLSYKYKDGVNQVGEKGDTAGKWEEIKKEKHP